MSQQGVSSAGRSSQGGSLTSQLGLPHWTGRNVDCYALIGQPARLSVVRPEPISDRRREFSDSSLSALFKPENSALEDQNQKPYLVNKSGAYELSTGADDCVPARLLLHAEFMGPPFPDQDAALDDAGEPIATAQTKESEPAMLFEELLHGLPWRTSVEEAKTGRRRPQACQFGEPFAPGQALSSTESNEWPLATLRLLRQRLANRLGVEFNSVVCRLYRDCRDASEDSDGGGGGGDCPSLGRHPSVAWLLLGRSGLRFLLAPRPGRRLRHQLSSRIEVFLPAGGLLLARGSLMRDWLISIPPDPIRAQQPCALLAFRLVASRPGERLTVLPDRSHCSALSERRGSLPAELWFTRAGLSKRIILNATKALFAWPDWLRPGEDFSPISGQSVTCKTVHFSASGGLWPDWIARLARSVSEATDNAKHGLPNYAHIEALLMQRINDHLAWQTSDIGPFMAVVAMGNEEVRRPLEMRRRPVSKSSLGDRDDEDVRGQLMSASIVLGSRDILNLRHGFFRDWQFRLPRHREGSGGRGVLFLLFRLSAPLPAGPPATSQQTKSSLKLSAQRPGVFLFTEPEACPHLCKCCSRCSEAVSLMALNGSLSDRSALGCPLCVKEIGRSVRLSGIPTVKGTGRTSLID